MKTLKILLMVTMIALVATATMTMAQIGDTWSLRDAKLQKYGGGGGSLDSLKNVIRYTEAWLLIVSPLGADMAVPDSLRPDFFDRWANVFLKWTEAYSVGFPADHIRVVYANGHDFQYAPPPYNIVSWSEGNIASITTNSGDRAGLTAAVSDLDQRCGQEDQLFVLITGAGGIRTTDTGEEYTLYLMDGELPFPELAGLMNSMEAGERVFWLANDYGTRLFPYLALGATYLAGASDGLAMPVDNWPYQEALIWEGQQYRQGEWLGYEVGARTDTLSSSYRLPSADRDQNGEVTVDEAAAFARIMDSRVGDSPAERDDQHIGPRIVFRYLTPEESPWDPHRQ